MVSGSLAERCGVPEISSFSSVLIQADRLGASIGTVLRAQSDLMRTERFQRAEKAGARASSIMLVPLVLFILPAALLVIVGPVLLRFIYRNGIEESRRLEAPGHQERGGDPAEGDWRRLRSPSAATPPARFTSTTRASREGTGCSSQLPPECASSTSEAATGAG